MIVLLDVKIFLDPTKLINLGINQYSKQGTVIYLNKSLLKYQGITWYSVTCSQVPKGTLLKSKECTKVIFGKNIGEYRKERRNFQTTLNLELCESKGQSRKSYALRCAEMRWKKFNYITLELELLM